MGKACRAGTLARAAAILALGFACKAVGEYLSVVEIDVLGHAGDDVEAEWGAVRVNVTNFAFNADDLEVRAVSGSMPIERVDVVVWADGDDDGQVDPGEAVQAFGAASNPPSASLTLSDISGTLGAGAQNVKYEVQVHTFGGGGAAWGAALFH